LGDRCGEIRNRTRRPQRTDVWKRRDEYVAIAERDRALGKLTNEGFLARAPAALVEAEREKAERFAAEASELERRLQEL